MIKQTVRVLLVEDNVDDVAIIRRMLRKYADVTFDVGTVGSAEECLDELGRNTFDLVLLDHGLPGESGLGLLRRLRSRPGSPPAIMLTGQGDQRVASQAMQDGAYDYFPKDAITSEALGRSVHQALEKYRLEEQLLDDQVEGTEQVIFSMAAAAEAKDPTTEDHLRRMARYAVDLGRALELDDRQLLLLRYGGILHDIGKIGVSETVLRAPRPLNQAEWQEMRQHPTIGERICSPLRLSHALGPIIRHHHERWDGAGYVDGLAGEDIPFLARVIAVVDAFDAMTSERPYRPALSLEEALSRLRAGAAKDWDPQITHVLLDLIHKEGQQFIIGSTYPKAA